MHKFMRESPQHGRRNKFLCNAKACASSTAPKCYVFLFSHSLPLRTLTISHSFVYNRKNAIDIFHKMPLKQTYTHNPHTQKFVPLKTGHNSNEMEKLLSQWLMIRYIYWKNTSERRVCVCLFVA